MEAEEKTSDNFHYISGIMEGLLKLFKYEKKSVVKGTPWSMFINNKTSTFPMSLTA